MKSLAMFAPGERGTVRDLRVNGSMGQRLMEMGFLPGAAVEFVRSAPLGDPIEVILGGSHLAIRRRDAAHIVVEGTEG